MLTGERLGLNPSAAVALLEHVRDPHRRRDLLHSALAKSDVVAITVAERVESLRLANAWRSPDRKESSTPGGNWMTKKRTRAAERRRDQCTS